MVGRLAERVLLEEQLALARAGHGRLAIVGGEAGIGKTTLARDLAVHARARGCAVLLGQSYDLMAVAPYGPWLDLFQRQGTETGSAPTPDVFAGGLPGITNQMDVFVQVRAYLQALAESGPVLLVLEDVHWADPASLDMLRYIGVHSTSIPLLVLVTYRVEELSRQNPFFRLLPNLIRETDGLRIDLKPLARRELRDFVESRYDLAESDIDRLVAYLDRHAEGNPFFVNELLRALEGEGEAGLFRREGGWRLAGIEGIVVPPLVRQVIETRVARMGNVTRDALAVAAVIGQDVLLDLWSHVAGIDEGTMLDIVDRAIEGYLFNASPDGTRVQFVHALTREALYQGIAPPRRRLIHQAVARALRDRAPVDPDPIAYHLRQARDPSAPEWLIRAGERAQRAYAWRSARDRFLEAAGLLADTHGDIVTQARLLYRCGRLQRYSDAPGGLRNLESAARLAEQAGDQVLRADAIYSQGLLRCFADDWATGVSRMAAGIEILEALSPEDGRGSWSAVNWMADALPAIDLLNAPEIDPAAGTLTAAGVNHRRGSLPWFMAVAGHLHRAREMADAFLGHVDGIDAGPLVLSNTGHSSFGLGIALSMLGQPEVARAAMGRARTIYGRLDHHAVIAFTYLTELTDIMIPWFATNLDDRQRVAYEAERALERAGEALPSGVSARRAYLPLMYLEGRWRDARALAAGSAEHGTYVLRRQVTHALAPIAYHRGDRDEAWRQIHSLLPGGSDAQPGSAVLLDALMLQRLAIDLCLDAGEADEARAWLE
ncbi:MAG: AAA family ATPase, partial [Chloroflexota bacterium]|nr:AAA family ATPase [Chloroflexota bacterium]